MRFCGVLMRFIHSLFNIGMENQHNSNVFLLLLWERKICPEDQRLASQGLLSDHGERFFLSHFHTNNKLSFLLTIIYRVFMFKKVSNAFLNALRCNIT